jgi:hypothetical protein
MTHRNQIVPITSSLVEIPEVNGRPGRQNQQGETRTTAAQQAQNQMNTGQAMQSIGGDDYT